MVISLAITVADGEAMLDACASAGVILGTNHHLPGAGTHRAVRGLVAEGAVVKNKATVPPRHIAVGVPAKVIGEITPEYEETWTGFKDIYVSLASERYPKSLRPIG